ncbi:hypothetical protein JCM11491_000773 [Sporobolomyces phaffii]
MDPFEIRMQFLTLISRLSSSLPSLSKVSSFALKHAQKCSDDIWDCLLDELSHSPSLNHRINLLYLIDLMLDKEGPPTTRIGAVVVGMGSYRALVERDLATVVDQVVPRESKQGVLNHMSAMQVLKSWRTKRLLDGDTLDQVITTLRDRKHAAGGDEQASATTFTDFSRNDILRRIEDDRERHKRLRERIWVLPIPSTVFQAPLLASSSSSASTNPKPSPISPASPFDSQPVSSTTASSNHRNPAENGGGGGVASPSLVRGPELALEIEFDQLWEATQEERSLVLGALDEAESEGQGARKRRRKVWELDPGEQREMRSETERCFHI